MGYTGSMSADVIAVSDAARAKISSLVTTEGEAGQMLRVRVVPGGCSGFEYQMLLDHPAADDELSAGCVAMDRASVPYLLGATLDYSEGFQAAGFQLANPNASGACGCGRSFAA